MFGKEITEKYKVIKPFRLVAWGDSHGCTEVSKTVSVGDEVELALYKTGEIRKIWVNGYRFGEYNLETSDEEIFNNIKKVI